MNVYEEFEDSSDGGFSFIDALDVCYTANKFAYVYASDTEVVNVTLAIEDMEFRSRNTPFLLR